jgi:hypothetical protein
VILTRFKKQSAESRKFTIDYSPRLDSSEVITNVKNVLVTPTTVPPLEVTSIISAAETSVYLYIAGGTDGTEYKVDVQTETGDALILWEDEIIMIIEDI